MELRHIRYFLEVAETLNFSRAAERLKVAQPALSRQIRDLEEELGGKLFYRTTAKVALTEMGHYFREQTRKIMIQLDIAATGAQQLAKGTGSTLKIGCDWRTPGLPIAAAAKRLNEVNRSVTVQFVEVPTHEHVSGVRDHTLDVGFVPSVLLGESEDLNLRSLCTLKMKVVLPAGHRLAARSALSLRELKEERWLALDMDSLPGFRVIMSEILQYTPKYGLTTTSFPGLIAHVIAGHGIGLIPDRPGVPLDDLTVAIDCDCAPIEMFAVSLRAPTSPLISSYLDLFQELIGRAAQPAVPPTPGRRAVRLTSTE